MKRLTMAVWTAAIFLAVLACVGMLLTGAVMVVQIALSGPWGVAWLLSVALLGVGWWCLCARRDRDRAERLLWEAQIREQELIQERNDARRQLAAYRTLTDGDIDLLLGNDTGES